MRPECNPIEQLIREANPLHGIGHEVAGKVGYIEALWAQKEFGKVIENDYYDNADSVRWCRIDNPKEVARFQKIASDSCCGCVEWESPDSEGQVWRFGFNYGH